MNEIDDRWRTGLQAEAVTIELTDHGSAERVVRRARRRSARRRGAAGVAASCVVVASGLAWQANRAHQRETPQELVVSDEPEGGADGGGPTELTPTTTMVVSPAPGSVDPSTLPDVPLTASGLTWRAEDVAFGKGLSWVLGGGARAGDGTLVALSTAPGVTGDDGTMQTAVYTSGDGVTWTGKETRGSHWFGDIVASGDRLVAVGTAAATGKIENPQSGGVGDVVVAVSSDDGGSWRDIVLPVDLRGPAKGFAARGIQAQISVVDAKVAHGPKGWLVAVGLQAGADVRSLLPATVDLRFGWTITADGAAVFKEETDPELAAAQRCMYGTGACDGTLVERMKLEGRDYTPTVDRVYTWAELGLDASLTDVLSRRVRLFSSADGESFTEVTAPAALTTGNVMYGGLGVAATATGFAVSTDNGGCCAPSMVGAGVGALQVWRTTDLQTWQALDAVPVTAGGMSHSLGELDGRLVVAGQQNGLPVVAVADGTTWTVTPLGKPLVAAGEQLVNTTASVGPSGVAVIGTTMEDPVAKAALSVSDNGYTMRIDGSQRGVSVTDPNGQVVARLPDIFNGAANAKVRVTPGGYDDGSGGVAFPTTAMAAPTATAVLEPTTTTMVGPVLTTPPATYQVRAGDIAVVIGEKAGLTLDQLQAANPAKDLDRLVPGDVLVVPDASAMPTATTPPPVQYAGGPSTMTVTDATTGAVLATFPLTELRQGWERALASAPTEVLRSRLLFSRDGRSWSLTDLAEVSGSASASAWTAVVTASGVIVGVRTGEADPKAPKPQFDGMPPYRQAKALVGTFA